MKKNKIINYLIAALIVSGISITGFFCTGTSDKKSGETRLNVIVENITSNDPARL